MLISTVAKMGRRPALKYIYNVPRRASELSDRWILSRILRFQIRFREARAPCMAFDEVGHPFLVPDTSIRTLPDGCLEVAKVLEKRQLVYGDQPQKKLLWLDRSQRHTTLSSSRCHLSRHVFAQIFFPLPPQSWPRRVQLTPPRRGGGATIQDRRKTVLKIRWRWPAAPMFGLRWRRPGTQGERYCLPKEEDEECMGVARCGA